MSRNFFHLTLPGSVLRARGADAFSFLQSQFSNDLRQPAGQNAAVYGLWLDRRGKIQADGFVLPQGETEFLVVSYDCPASVVKGHLEAHLIADEMELSDATAGYSMLRVWSEGGELPPLVKANLTPGERLVWPGRQPKKGAWDVMGRLEVMQPFITRLQEGGFQPVAREEVQRARILAGIPRVADDAGPGDLPQEAGLEREAVSFFKGCYLGQEVMARLQAQGHVNRALWLVEWKPEATLPAEPKSLTLFAGDTPAGELRSRVPGTGLAMLKKRVLNGRTALSFGPNGPEVVTLVRDVTQA